MRYLILTLALAVSTLASAQSLEEANTFAFVDYMGHTMECDEEYYSCTAADVNGDGTVTIQDLLLWSSDFGTACLGCPSDIDGDGFVTVMDKLVFLAYYGQTCD